MGYSERSLIVIRNMAAAHFLSGFCLFLVGWGYGLPNRIVFGIPTIAYLTALFFSREAFRNFHFKSLHKSLETLPRVAMGVIALFLILNILFCLLPPAENLETDALNYHFVIPWQYYLRGGVVNLDWSVPDKYPLYLQMAQLPFTVISFPWIVKIGNMIALPTLLVVAWNLFRLMGLSRNNAAWMVALLSSFSLFVKQYGTAMFDLANAAYCLLGFLYLLRATLSRKGSDMLWGAAILGMACATKTFLIYYAIVWFVAFFVWTIFCQRKSMAKSDFALSLLPLLMGIVFLTPVWCRNFLLTGNPFYPLFLKWFGTLIENEGFYVVMRNVTGQHGYGRSLVDFLLGPLRLVLPFHRRFDYWVDPILLVFLFGAFAELKSRWREIPGLMALIAFLFYMAFFFTTQEARYLYPFWVMVVALGAPWIFLHIQRKWRGPVFAVQIIVGISMFFLFHRQALGWLRHGPLDQYLYRASYSFVWNENLESKRIHQLCLANVGTPKLPRDVLDILYFTVPVKLIQHFNSTISITNPRALEGCDAFMLGDQDPEERDDPPSQQPRLVTKEIFLFEQTKTDESVR